MIDWTSWVLASSVLLALYDIAKKASVSANAVLPVLLTSTSFGFAAYSAGLFATGHFCALDEISGATLSLGVAKSVIVGTSWVFTFCALRTLPITIATPIRASSPALVLLIAIPLYGEMPSVLQGVGMAAVFVGAVCSAVSSIWDKYPFLVRAMPSLFASVQLLTKTTQRTITTIPPMILSKVERDFSNKPPNAQNTNISFSGNFDGFVACTFAAVSSLTMRFTSLALLTVST